MTRPFAPIAAGALLSLLAGCGPSYSPNTYSANAVQQAEKVDKGIIVGVRSVDVTSSGVVGATAGAAAGGALGAQTPGGGVTSTLGAIGGGLVGGLIGTSVEHVTTDTTAYEYIVQKPTKDLVSVTQKDARPLTIGMHVLVIAGPQARIVPDYTVEPDPTATLTPPPSPKPAGEPPVEKPAAVAASPGTPGPTPQTTSGVTAIAPPPPAVGETPLALLPALPTAAATTPAAAGAAIGATLAGPAPTPPAAATPAAEGAAVGARVASPAPPTPPAPAAP